MKETPNAIYMEPEEYEAYLKEQEERQEKLKAYYESLKEGNDNVDGPSLYELNQQIIGKMPALDGDGVRNCSGKILKWLDANPDSYYMLLCNELSYYTLFRIKSAKETNNGLLISRGAMRDLTNEILDIVEHLGDVRVIEEDNNGAIAVWSSLKPAYVDMLPEEEISDDVNTVHCFYLFPYGRGVVEV